MNHEIANFWYYVFRLVGKSQRDSASVWWTAIIVGPGPPSNTKTPRSGPMLVIETFDLHIPRRRTALELFSNVYSVDNMSVVACWAELGKSLSHLVVINSTSIHPGIRLWKSDVPAATSPRSASLVVAQSRRRLVNF